jgi:tRNA(Arg) A34 adenosine deaminase TadA
MVAFMVAQQRIGSFTLAGPGMPAHELVTSCEPCAMCLGATLWSGVRRVVYGAAREDASRLAFEEGPSSAVLPLPRGRHPPCAHNRRRARRWSSTGRGRIYNA